MMTSKYGSGQVIKPLATLPFEVKYQTGDYRKSQAEGQHPGIHIEPKMFTLARSFQKIYAQ